MFQRRVSDSLAVGGLARLIHAWRICTARNSKSSIIWSGGGDGQTPLQITNALQVTKTPISHSHAVLENRGVIETRSSISGLNSKQVFVAEDGCELQKQAVIALTGLCSSFLREEDCQTMGDALPSLVSVRKLLETNSVAVPGRRRRIVR